MSEGLTHWQRFATTIRGELGTVYRQWRATVSRVCSYALRHDDWCGSQGTAQAKLDIWILTQVPVQRKEKHRSYLFMVVFKSLFQKQSDHV